jgi:hypothetical protein
MIRVGLTVLLGLALGLVGCGGGDEKKPAAGTEGATEKTKGKDETKAKEEPKPALLPIGVGGKVVAAKTPKEAWLNFAEATHTGDRLMLRSSVQVPEAARAYIESDFVRLAALRILRREMAEAYGEAALEDHFKGVPTDEYSRAEEEARVKIEQQGEAATVSVPGGDTFQLVKKGGKWLVDLMDQPLPPADEQTQKTIKNEATIRTVNAVRPKVGTAGYAKAEDALRLMAMIYERNLESWK